MPNAPGREFTPSADDGKGLEMAAWGRLPAIDRPFRRMYLVCTLMGMLFSDWEESHARNRQWWKTPYG